MIIAPSLLAANFAQLQQETEWFNNSQAQWLHFDVMDGHFVPNISFGLPILQAIRPFTSKVIDVHLMVTQPQNWIEKFAQAGANNISIHHETQENPQELLNQIKQTGCKAGLAINPNTPIEHIQQHLHHTDILLIMSVQPGFGGQLFIPSTYQKITQALAYITQHQLPTQIQIDGGVTNHQAAQLAAAGAHILVSGSYIFNAPNRAQAIQSLIPQK
jgi:ribulose-phosphate 3-epimerase